ncbi:signal peptidase I SipW [Desulfitobacterium metallireducens]|uniref:Signal peptidase I n=1 Tax=Desulfitobacterium metallireducens DSM 15288 TaxID=871968 RepID=W0E4Z3_9FIRM|nr:signal peptidase I [Desulfitobacterium metallireducens]AHF05930.1 peptidase S26 [Desulfitobacterium metallireducens DSM 15288]
MKRALKWGGNIVTVILGVALILTVYASVTSRMNNGTPKLFGHQMYEVLSGSMEPGIHTGSVIFDKPGVDVKTLKEGDVITFKAKDDPKMLITHRIVRVKTQDGAPAFQTKGDANDVVDKDLVPGGNIVAQYNNITIPYLGYYLNFMKSKNGILFLVIVPGIFLILSTMISLSREIIKLENDKKTDKTEVSSHVSSENATKV